MQKLVFAYGCALASMEKALRELEQKSAAIMRKGGVPQGGVSIASDETGAVNFHVAQAFLIDE